MSSYPGLGLQAQVYQYSKQSQGGDGGSPGQQVHIRVSIGLEETDRQRDQWSVCEREIVEDVMTGLLHLF